MNVQSLTKGLKYIGEAEGKRQTYYVFEGDGYFFVISFKKGDPTTGNFSVVESEAVHYVAKKFGGTKGVRSQDVFTEAKKTRFFKGNLNSLNALYVLVAMKKARVDSRHKSIALYFNFR